MDDPSQSAASAAGRQDRALQEKYRAKLQEGAMTGLVERNSKWDVEYEGKDAKGTLVRPFEPGFGDARALPGKMLGESTRDAVQRSMGRNLPHSGMGDGTSDGFAGDGPKSNATSPILSFPRAESPAADDRRRRAPSTLLLRRLLGAQS